MDLIRISFEKYIIREFDYRLLRKGEGYAGPALNRIWEMWKFAHKVAEQNNVSFCPLDTKIPDIFTAEEWGTGMMCPSDGYGCWCIASEGLESSLNCFEDKPEWADSVAWYNK